MGYIARKREAREAFIKKTTADYERIITNYLNNLGRKRELYLQEGVLEEDKIKGIQGYMKEIKDKLSKRKITLTQYQKSIGKLTKEIQEKTPKEKRIFMKLEKILASATAAILILAATLLFSSSSNPIIGYAVLTPTGEINYMIVLGVIYLIIALFILFKKFQ